jgi:hypothetical protein
MDRVHTIDDIHDGRPLSGVADFEGHPHFYQCQFDEQLDDWSDQYVLKKIDPALLAIALERQEIFLRWRKAFDDGKTPIDRHPSLESDRPRYDELKKIIESQTAGLPETARAVGKFDAISRDTFTSAARWMPVDPQ